MIKITRGECPESLNNPPLRESDYSKDDVKQALADMQYGKCAYCERKLGDGKQIDHFIPKNEHKSLDDNGKTIYDWDELNKWTNLLYACSNCNGAQGKGGKLPKDRQTGEPKLIDPSSSDQNMDPERHITYEIINPLTYKVNVFPRTINNSRLGETTIEILRLGNRKDYLGGLKTKALKLSTKFEKFLLELMIKKSLNDSECIEKQREIQKDMHRASEYSAFARIFIEKRLEEFNKKQKIDFTEVGIACEISFDNSIN